VVGSLNWGGRLQKSNGEGFFKGFTLPVYGLVNRTLEFAMGKPKGAWDFCEDIQGRITGLGKTKSISGFPGWFFRILGKGAPHRSKGIKKGFTPGG